MKTPPATTDHRGQFAPAHGSAHLVGAVVCCECGCDGRSDEMQYHNHGDGVEGWTCEPCQGVVKDYIADMYQRFLKRCDELKAEAAGSGKDAQNAKLSDRGAATCKKEDE